MSTAIRAQAGSLKAAPIAKSLVFRPCSIRAAGRPQLRSASGDAGSRMAVVTFAKGGKGGKGGKAEAPAKEEKGGKGGAAAGGGADVQKIAAEAKKDADERMKKCLAVVGDGFNTIRTGRANPAILDKITVDYFGAPTPLKQMGTVTVPDASTLMITPFDKTSLRDIERAIQESDIGINPNNDGERIRLIMPPMTQERRKDLAKQVSKMAEDGKVAVRNVRKDALKKVDKVELPKDDKKALEDDIQKLTDTYVKKVEDAAKAKTEEVMKL
ncbi:hypothetical protein CHLRE_03g156050v5 [Chlamydomonas reinhardtii]|uniref:Ribosome-recycling factor, chloroplastic n=1 Tax=Chlamydomonas reinhardtii TaxID=3055 RepID=A0A2K3DW10_CHLRE|nr:uncharacterized protein CHLRE_03g156050v5 [Chlamydomonas reinhardtii]PNW84721.1 hypothetical protein CHLRE_03g156050v5 [Chlamydomonas reinhardtii]